MSFVFEFTPPRKHVFIHIPKNGGTSLIRSLEPYNPYAKKKKRRPNKRFVGHLTYRETIRLLSPKEDLSFFCIARNPWARAVSYFHYVQQFEDHHEDQKVVQLLKKGMSFSEFTIYICENETSPYKAQYEYMCDDEGALAIDDVFELSSIQEDVSSFLKKQSLPTLEFKKENASRHADYKKFYDSEETIKRIASFEKGVIDLCHFRFGS